MYKRIPVRGAHRPEYPSERQEPRSLAALRTTSGFDDRAPAACKLKLRVEMSEQGRQDEEENRSRAILSGRSPQAAGHAEDLRADTEPDPEGRGADGGHTFEQYRANCESGKTVFRNATVLR
jgi:hypothetical protein